MLKALVPLSRELVWVIVSSFSAMLWGQSRYAVPFENYRRDRDPAAFARDMQKAEELGIDLRDEVPFLAGLVASSGDTLISEEARLKLFLLAWGQGLNADPAVRDLFRPAAAVFKTHLDEALKDECSRWASSIASLTAFAGVQPDQGSLALFFRMVDCRDKRAQGMGLIALARLKPLPSEAKGLLLSRLSNYPLRDRLEVLAFAIDDPDILKTYAKSLESNDVEEQRAAALMLSRIGSSAQPALDVLQRLQRRSGLDEQVSIDVRLAVDRIENKTAEQDR